MYEMRRSSATGSTVIYFSPQKGRYTCGYDSTSISIGVSYSGLNHVCLSDGIGPHVKNMITFSCTSASHSSLSVSRSRTTILVACCELVGTSPGLRLDFCPSYGLVEFQNRHCFWKSQDHPIFHRTSGSPSADALNICTSYKGHRPKGQSVDSARTFYT
jgi:hypothetical protein